MTSEPGPAGRAEPNPFDAEDIRARVNKHLAAFLAAQEPAFEAISPELRPLSEAVAAFLLDAGKRLRPAFCYWGWRGAGGGDSEEIVAAATSLEMLHGCALIHDDVMDDSDTRRGMPSTHRRFAGMHRASGWVGNPDGFGRSAAILLGDLCLIWSEQMLRGSGLPERAIARGLPVFDETRVELMAGQYLDVLEQAVGGGSLERALAVARFKSGRYTVERPLQLGAALAGADQALRAAYAGYGLPLGEAFQLRDDVLGVFGDPAETGKPAGDDLREGKRTALVAVALERASGAQQETFRRHLGDPHLSVEGVQALREAIVDTGALDAVEGMIADRVASALAALDGAPVDRGAADVLRGLAVAATTRRV